MTSKTSQLELRLHALEMEKALSPETPFLGKDGNVVPGLRDTIEKLVEEVGKLTFMSKMTSTYFYIQILALRLQAY